MKPPDGVSIDKTVLANGVRILTKQMPHMRSVSLGVWVNVGARDERLAESGLSHFIEHMIFKGTARRTAFQIAREFDAIGGFTNAFTSMENTCYHAKVLDTHSATMVDILSDIFLNSIFDENEVERERTVIVQELGMVEDNPDEYVHQLAGKAFWGDDPLGRSILGTRENILAFDAEAVKDFFQRLYQPERILIAAAGNLDHNRLVDLMGPNFESIGPGNGIPERTTPLGCHCFEKHLKDLEQAHFCIVTRGLAVNSRERYALFLMNTILGGNMSSRLFQEIRERRGLAYTVYSFANSYIDTGMFGVYAGVDPRNIGQAITVSCEQLRRLKTEPVSPAELEAAKEFTKGNLLLAAESNDNQMVRLAQNEFNFGYYTPLGEIVEKVEAVSEADIMALANDLFRGDRLSLTLLGPVNHIDNAADLMQL